VSLLEKLDAEEQGSRGAGERGSGGEKFVLIRVNSWLLAIDLWLIFRTEK
jgi:hypothetical protein